MTEVVVLVLSEITSNYVKNTKSRDAGSILFLCYFNQILCHIDFFVILFTSKSMYNFYYAKSKDSVIFKAVPKS